MGKDCFHLILDILACRASVILASESLVISWRVLLLPSLILMAAEGWRERNNLYQGGGRRSQIKRRVGVGELRFPSPTLLPLPSTLTPNQTWPVGVRRMHCRLSSSQVSHACNTRFQYSREHQDRGDRFTSLVWTVLHHGNIKAEILQKTKY